MDVQAVDTALAALHSNGAPRRTFAEDLERAFPGITKPTAIERERKAYEAQRSKELVAARMKDTRALASALSDLRWERMHAAMDAAVSGDGPEFMRLVLQAAEIELALAVEDAVQADADARFPGVIAR